MTQGKKKKRAANRSIMLAKKIIIKDGGTVSWGTAPGSVPRGPPIRSLPPTPPPPPSLSAPALPHPVGAAYVSASWALLFLLRGFPLSSRPAASGAHPLGEAACLSRTCRPILRRPLEGLRPRSPRAPPRRAGNDARLSAGWPLA